MESMHIKRVRLAKKHAFRDEVIFLAALAMGFVSYLLSRCRMIRQKADDTL
jgi:hypothetical protein